MMLSSEDKHVTKITEASSPKHGSELTMLMPWKRKTAWKVDSYYLQYLMLHFLRSLSMYVHSQNKIAMIMPKSNANQLNSMLCLRYFLSNACYAPIQTTEEWPSNTYDNFYILQKSVEASSVCSVAQSNASVAPLSSLR
jgi:hypothetical protein